MDATTVSAEYTDATGTHTPFVVTESVSGKSLADILEREQGLLNAKLTAMMAAEKNNSAEPESPLPSPDKSSTST
ncbi:hypothetical protein H4S07_002539, partial [Coemansia furcata]